MIKLIFSKYIRNSKLYIGTLLAIVLTTAIICSCLNLVSGTLTSTNSGNRFNACDIVIATSNEIKLEYIKDNGSVKTKTENLYQRPPMTQTQIDEIQDIKNITKLIYDKSFYIDIQQLPKSKPILGHNVESIELSGFRVDGSLPKDNEVIIDSDFAKSANLGIGDKINIETRYGTSDFLVCGIANSASPNAFDIQNFFYFSERFSDKTTEGIYNIGVITNNISSVTQEAKNKGFEVYSGSKINNAEFDFIKKNYFSAMIVFITMGSICLLSSVFVILGTIMFSVKHRRREIGMLRTIGMCRSQFNMMLIIENAIILFLATIIGILLANPVAEIIKRLFVDVGIIDNTFIVSQNIGMLAIAISSIWLITIFVALVVGAKSMSISPMQAIKEEDTKVNSGNVIQYILGLLLFLGGLSIIIFTPYYGGFGVGMGFCVCALFLSGAMLFAPLLMKLINGVLSLFTRRMSKSLGQVANANIKQKCSKFAIAAISLSLMFSLNAVMYLNNVTYINDNAFNRFSFVQDYNYFIKNASPSYDYDDCLIIKNSELVCESRKDVFDVKVMGVNDYSKVNLKLIDGRLPTTTNEIMVTNASPYFKIGDTVTSYLPNAKKIEFTVVGTYYYKYRNNSESGIPDILMDYRLLNNSSFNWKYSNVYFNFTEAEKVLFEQSEVGRIHPLSSNSTEQYKQGEEFNVQMGAIALMTIISFALTVIALFNTFAMIMNVRKKEFNGLRLLGAEKKQIRRMTTIETLIVVITGMIMGVLFTALAVAPYSFNAFGIYDFIVDPKVFLGLFVGVAILGYIAGILPSLIVISQLKKQTRNE